MTVSSAVPDVPSDYGTRICAELANGMSVADIAAGLGRRDGFSLSEARALIGQSAPQYCAGEAATVIDQLGNL